MNRPCRNHRAVNLGSKPNSSLFPAKPHWPTWNVKLPSDVWVSTESTCHFTWYVPVPPGRSETDIWLPLMRGLAAWII